MELIMIVLSRASMSLNEAERRKMHSSLQKSLINIEFYFSLNMNIAEEVVKMLSMYLV